MGCYALYASTQVDLQRRTVVWLRKWLFHAKVGGVSAERKRHSAHGSASARLGMAQSLVGTNGKYRRQYVSVGGGLHTYVVSASAGASHCSAAAITEPRHAAGVQCALFSARMPQRWCQQDACRCRGWSD